jgi:hypothetical protein
MRTSLFVASLALIAASVNMLEIARAVDKKTSVGSAAR